MLSHLRGWSWAKTGQESLLRSPLQPERAACCPIRVEIGQQTATLPEHGAEAGEEPGEAMRPATPGMEESQQHIHQQRRPQLPLDRVTVVAEKVSNLQRLLDLLEKHLDIPAGLVEVADAVGTAEQ